MTTILHKRGTGTPPADQLTVGEIAIDTLAGKLYTKQSDGSVVEIGGGSEGGSGGGLTISPSEPVDPSTGDMWLESTTGRVWIFDEDKWLEFPCAGGEVDTNIPIIDTPPENPELGQQWFSSTDGYLYVWYGAEWVATNTNPAVSGDGGSGGDSDPNWSSVALLSQGAGMGVGELMTDFSGNATITSTGANGYTTDAPEDLRWGGPSFSFSSSSSGGVYASVPSDELTFGTGDFTIEFYLLHKSGGANTSPIILDWREAGVNSDVKPAIYMQSTTPRFRIGTTNVSGPYVPYDSWMHIAVVRMSGAVRVYTNGISGDPVTLTNNLQAPDGSRVHIGHRGEAANTILNANIESLRITKGVARYTANFLPPSKFSEDGLKVTYWEEKDADLP